MVALNLKALHKYYGVNHIVKGVDLDIKDQEFVVLVGPSGCGKSTTLRMIAGLEAISGGEIQIGSKRMNEVAPSDRGVAMVFQDYALYPHMTVYENMAFSLTLKKWPKEKIKERVMIAAKMLDLESYLERKPAALSGGQRQRVAMGRAIVKQAQVFLFDEPLSNLDAKLRGQMRVEIKKFHLKTKTTTVYVTHDQLEAMTLADRLVVMNKGVIEQMGTPMEVFENPRTIFVATFIGSPSMNLFKGTIERIDGHLVFVASNEGVRFKLPASKAALVQEGMRTVMGIRPSDIFLADSNDGLSEDWKANGVVEVIELLGKNAFLNLKIGQDEFVGEIMGRHTPKVGDEVRLSFNLNHVHLFDDVTGLNLANK